MEGAAANVTGKKDVESLGALVEVVEERRNVALEAATRVQEAVAKGNPTSTEDLEQLSDYNQVLAEAWVKLGSTEGEEADRGVEALRAAARAVKARCDEREQETEVLTDALRRLASAPTDDGSSLLGAPRRRAAELCEPGMLDDDENRRVAQGLGALVRLNESGGEDKAALTAEATELLPSDCQPAVGVAAYGNLELAATPGQDGATDPVADDEPAVEQRAEVQQRTESEEEEAADEEATRSSDPAPADRDGRPAPSEAVAIESAKTVDDAAEAVEPADEEVEVALGNLLRERRFGLAHWIVAAWPSAERGLENALEALAYAASMRSPIGESASRFRDLMQDFPFDTLRGDRIASLIALTAGLRGNLVAPYSGAGELLKAVATSYSEYRGLSSLIEAVMVAGQRGLSAPDMTKQVQNIASAEDDLRAVQERAEQMLRLSTIKYARASKVWLNWIDPDEMLGSLLTAVAANRVEALEQAKESVLMLRDTKTLERQLDATDQRLTAANRRRKIVEDARAKLIERAEESLAIVSDWVDVSRELDRVKRKEADENWQKGLLEDLRTAARDAREEVISIWEEWGRGEDLAAAAAVSTLPIIEEMFALVIDGMRLEGEEEQVNEILGLDLLRAPGLGLNARLEPIDELRLSSLIVAARSDDWAKAFEARIVEANFAAAERIVEVVGRDDPELAAKLDKSRLNRLAEKRDHLTGRIEDAVRLLGGARREGRISDSESLSLNSRLSALELNESDQDFRGRDETITVFLADLRQAEEEGERKAREEYGPRLTEEQQLQPHRERLQGLLDRGEIATLEELILAIERGEVPPEEEDLIFRQLTEFFPHVAAEPKVTQFARDGNGLTEAIAGQGRFGTLDFSSLKDEEVEPVQAAVDAWRRLDCGELKSGEEDLVRVLDLVGLTVEAGVDAKIWQKHGADKRRRGDITAKPLGKALVPAFGSDVQGGRYRLLMLWERMSDDAIAALISQEDGEQPVVVLGFGTALPETVRRGVAEQLRHQPIRRAVALIDGPAFLYIASKGGRNLGTTMRITLPFSAVNPYTPFAPGSVPLEMFYGRDRELSGIIDRHGTSFIYGGRRLGKSALLRAAERKFVAEAPGTNKAIYVDLKTKGIGEREPADMIVSEIAKALKDAGVMTYTAAKEPAFEDIRTEVKAWLGNESRRILLLLDECDAFLNEDAKARFPNVSELKALMEETDRRFKPVFAGLHQVRRFQRIPNQPLAHLGYPTPVGPLKPQPAYDLITKPLEALGLKFETADLPARILTATNYQPSLIQLFCSELVDHMLDKACGPGTPPYVITSNDVDAVHTNQRVVEGMRSRFELTTHLDPRYGVIANSVAVEALGSDVTVGLGASEIRAMCDEYWPAGFAKTGSDEFRSLLEEMDSLGVLFEDDEGRFLMRSPNVLRMLGTPEQIEESLNASNELDLPEGFEAASFRDRLENDPYRPQPFTHEQVADLLGNDDAGEDSRLRVVVGSAATGIDEVMTCLQGIFGDGSRYSFKDASSQDFKRLRGRFKRPPKNKRRAIAYRLKPVQPNENTTGIRSLAEKMAEPDLHSTLVFVLDTEELSTWRTLVAPEGVGGNEGAAVLPDGIELIELKRWSKAGLRAWAQAQDAELFFNENVSLNELIRVTGGWPVLVNRVVEAYRQDHDWRGAIKGLESWLDSSEGSAALCEAIGLGVDAELAKAWNMFIVYDEPIAREEVQSLAEQDGIEDAGRAAELLRSMQVLELDSKGRYAVERTAARAWEKVGRT